MKNVKSLLMPTMAFCILALVSACSDNTAPVVEADGSADIPDVSSETDGSATDVVETDGSATDVVETDGSTDVVEADGSAEEPDAEEPDAEEPDAEEPDTGDSGDQGSGE